jgi:Tol biopolymer transport system component
LHDVGDARIELERAIAGHDWTSSSPASPAGARGWLLTAGVVCVVAVLATAGGWLAAGRFVSKAPVAPAQTLHVATLVQDKPPFSNLVGIAPDARFLVYTAWPELPPESVKPQGLLMVRRLDRDETITIDGSEGAREAALSPDGRWVAFSCAKDRAGTKFSLKRVALDNGRPAGRPETVCELSSSAPPALCWASDREIVFSPGWEPVLYAVSSSGGAPREVLREDRPKGIESWADFRPLIPGKSILATRWSFVGQKVKVNTEVIDLASGKRTLLLPDAASAVYLPDENGGYLVATRTSLTSLIAVRFDPAALRTIGEPVTVWSGNPMTGFRIASGGTLAVTTRPAEVLDRRLAWIDDKGQPQPIPGMTRSFGEIVVSPDGRRVLTFIESAGTDELVSDCWMLDLTRRTSARIPVDGAMIGMVWSPDGQQMTYGLAKDGEFSIWQRRSDGSGEPVKLCSSPDSRTLLVPSGWTLDGKRLAFLQIDLSSNTPDAYLLEQDAASRQWAAKPYVKSPGADEYASFSPDGKWVVMRSDQSGRGELYAQRFTGDGEADVKAGRVPVSTSGGGLCMWSKDGKEIRYLDSDSQVMSVQVQTEPTFSVSEPKLLYSIKDLKTRGITFAPDGRLLVVLQGQSEQSTTSVGLVINFMDELRAKIPKAP